MILSDALGEGATVATRYTAQLAVSRPAAVILPIEETAEGEGTAFGDRQVVEATMGITLLVQGDNGWEEADALSQSIEAAISGDPTLRGTISDLAYAGFETVDSSVEDRVYVATISYTGTYTVTV